MGYSDRDILEYSLYSMEKYFYLKMEEDEGFKVKFEVANKINEMLYEFESAIDPILELFNSILLEEEQEHSAWNQYKIALIRLAENYEIQLKEENSRLLKIAQ